MSDHPSGLEPVVPYMVTGVPGLFDTRAAALRDDEALHIRFWMEEPFLAANQRERDDIVFLDRTRDGSRRPGGRRDGTRRGVNP